MGHRRGLKTACLQCFLKSRAQVFQNETGSTATFFFRNSKTVIRKGFPELPALGK